MEKKDKLTILVFIVLIIAIISVLFINFIKNQKIQNVDRKVEYIMGYSYDTILNRGEKLFVDTISLLTKKDIFDYNKDLRNNNVQYNINGKDYLKINNFNIAHSNFSNNTINDYMKLRKIIYFENNYYIENFKIDINNYIGSMISIDNYKNNIIYFNSINYYCEESEFVGLLDKEPNCNYQKEETNFSVSIENGIFKINNVNDFKFLIK